VRQWSARLGETLQFAPSDCFANFAFPPLAHLRSSIGDAYSKLRTGLLTRRTEGLTQVYNRFHNPDETCPEILKLREFHVEMDSAVAAAYGWTTFDLGHGFHDTKQGVRYTVSDPARREIIARLLKLNQERYAEEVKQGLHDTTSKRAAGGAKKPKKTTKHTAADTRPASLFDNTVDTAFPSMDREKRLCGLLCDLVYAQPELSSIAYLDALVIALRPRRHSRLLIGKDQKQVVALAEKLLPNTDQAGGSLPWADMINLLTHHEAIIVGSAQTLEVGSRHAEARKAYPPCDPKLIQLIHKAAATLREYQGPSKEAVADSQEVLSAFIEDKRSLCGATT
jgi:hypothetical protein